MTCALEIVEREMIFASADKTAGSKFSAVYFSYIFVAELDKTLSFYYNLCYITIIIKRKRGKNMPPKVKITKEMIIDAAFEIARSDGAEKINARTVSKKLGCSTQPVMYHFKTIEELKKTVYIKADEYHSEYINNIQSENPMKDIGLNYIRFAETEKNLFRFLFQTNEFTGKNISELINSEELQPVIAILRKEAEVNTEQAKTIFRLLFLIAHGYASMFANNEMTYDEQTMISDLDLVFEGTVYSLKGDL